MKVLFVCMGNICRSPTAEAVFRQVIRQSGDHAWIHIDSAGTHAYHVGNPPDGRSQRTAQARGIQMDDLRARKVDFADFYQFDLVLAMDKQNYQDLMDMAPDTEKHRIKMMMDFAPEHPQREVPDPYYGGAEGFEQVFDMLQQASEGLLSHLKTRKKA